MSIMSSMFEDFPFSKITLRSHTPPSSNVVKIRFYGGKKLPDLTVEEERRSPLETILEWPPLPGHVGEHDIKIQLLGEMVAAREDRRRLFQALITSGTSTDIPHIDEEAKGNPVVAEIFDPLSISALNPSIVADLWYSRAVTVYERLEDLQGKIIPKFYGSYTMKVPVNGHPKHKDREIRVILREYIEGKGLNRVDPESLAQNQRQRLMEKVIEAEQIFDNRGIGIMSNYSPSSVILTDGTDIQVVVSCFTCAIFDSDLEVPYSIEQDYYPGKFASPLLKWPQVTLEESGFGTFVDWDWLNWLKEELDSAPSTGITNDQKGPAVGQKSAISHIPLGNSQLRTPSDSSSNSSSHSFRCKSASQSEILQGKTGKRVMEELQKPEEGRKKPKIYGKPLHGGEAAVGQGSAARHIPLRFSNTQFGTPSDSSSTSSSHSSRSKSFPQSEVDRGRTGKEAMENLQKPERVDGKPEDNDDIDGPSD
ncbi:hypothetical protein TRVA0_038S00166 [Trichomonascus vanleenenianus]|uniref:uncharacterized protein n=1 Tax=Trichomonascus vanleenenianus TaxID=2268995 RepID=UPI003ECB6CA5